MWIGRNQAAQVSVSLFSALAATDLLGTGQLITNIPLETLAILSNYDSLMWQLATITTTSPHQRQHHHDHHNQQYQQRHQQQHHHHHDNNHHHQTQGWGVGAGPGARLGWGAGGWGGWVGRWGWGWAWRWGWRSWLFWFYCFRFFVLGWCSNCARLVLKLCSAGAQIVLG